MKFIIILSLSFLTTTFSFCQSNIVFHVSKNDSYIFNYVEKPTNKETKRNFIIEEISKYIPKNLKITQFTYQYSYEITITNTGKTSSDNNKIYSASIKINNEKCTGDINYKGFSIAEFLIPSFFDFTLLIDDAKNNTLKPIPFVATIKKNASEFPYSSSDSIARINLTNKLFYYNDSNINVFNKRIQLINDYYNSEKTISSAYEKLKSINLDNAEIVKVHEISLKEVEALITELSDKNFTSLLNLSKNDPINFVTKLNELSQKAKNLRLLINQMLNNLDKVFYDKGIEFLNKSDTLTALKYLEKATITNPNYCLAYYKIAEIYFYQKNYDKVYSPINIITTKTKPNPELLKQTIELGHNVIKINLNNAEKLINEEAYHAALDILEKLKTFCTNTPAINCSNNIQNDISKAKYGIYMSFVIVSQKAIEKEILDIGEIYTIKAKEYQQKNSDDLKSSAEVDNLLNQLVNKLTIDGLKLNAIQRFDTASNLFERAFEIYKKYPDIKYGDKVLSQLTQAKKGIFKSLIIKAGLCIRNSQAGKADTLITEAISYQTDNFSEITDKHSIDSITILLKKLCYDKLINNGISYLKNINGISALESFNSAKKIETNYSINKNKCLDSLILASAKPYILNYIEKACVKTWGNELDKARKLGDTAIALQKKYSLTYDTTINNALSDLNTKIKNQKCRNTLDAYNENFRTAFKFISQKKYSDADDYFNKCLAIINENKDCNISDSLIKKSKEKYLITTIYQRKLKSSDSLASITKYYEAINMFFESEKYFTSHNMTPFGLVHQSLKDYALNEKDNNYICYCANYFLDRSDFTAVFEYLEILRSKNYLQALTSGIQESLASKLVAIDFANNNKQKPATLIYKYTNGNLWYDYFIKTYQSKWKELKKKNNKFFVF